MPIARLVAIAALVTAAQGSALAQAVTPGCSGTLTTSNLNGISLVCTGNYVLADGQFESDKSIFVRATGTLYLQDVSFKAPDITLVSFGAIGQGSGVFVEPYGMASAMVTVNAQNVMSSNIIQSPQALVLASLPKSTVIRGPLPSVPEQSTFALLALGLGGIGLAALRKGSKA